MSPVTAFLVAAVVVVCCVNAQTDMDVGMTTVEVTVPPTTEEPITEFSLELYHRESFTESVSIVWRPRVPEGITIEKYHVRTTRKDSDSVITSPDLPASTSDYTVEHLVKDSRWRICVVTAIANSTHSDTYEQCVESFTIPYIRNDSMYVLALSAAVIGALILLGYLSWRCAINDAEKRAALLLEAEEEQDDDDEGKLIKPVQAKPVLLSPVDNSPDRPKSSIEDEDIPFITPPWSEIEREEQAKAHRYNNVA